MTFFHAFVPDKQTGDPLSPLIAMKISDEGVNIWALVFGPLWAFSKGAWPVAIVMIAINSLSAYLFSLLGGGDSAELILGLIPNLIFGFFGTNLILTYWRLRGWRDLGLFAGTRPEAEAYYISLLLEEGSMSGVSGAKPREMPLPSQGKPRPSQAFISPWTAENS